MEAMLTVNAYARILPYLWPYRRPLLVSVFCAVIVSLFWAANLSATLPVVEVLFKDKSLHDYVDSKIADAQAEVDEHARAHEAAANDPEKQARAWRKGHSASFTLSMLRTVRDEVLPWVPRDAFRALILILSALLIGTFFKGLFVYFEECLVGEVINRVVVDVRKDCFRHALQLDYQTIGGDGNAHFISRLTNDVEVIGLGLSALLVRLIREPLKIGSCVAFAFFVNWRLTLLSILVMPTLGLVIHRFGKAMKRASHGTLESMTAIQKVLSETFDSVKAVIAFGAGREHRHQFHQANKHYIKKQRRVLRLGSMNRQLTELIGVMAVLAAVFPGSYLVLNKTDSILGLQLANGIPDTAELAVLYALLAGTLDSIRKMSNVNRELRRGAAASERIIEILDAKTRVPEPKVPRLLPSHEGELVFDNVTFTYLHDASDGARPPALHNVSLTVKKGEVVAVVGANGSGKSTLINLVPRFYDPDSGAIRLDGVDLRDVSTRELRSRIGVVSQETLLFDDSIFNNIRYGRDDATAEDVEEAARQAHVIPFVTQLPDGFETSIGAKGMKLSGGQRQRIALARAIIRDPDILILDEATSAVDSQSEQIIHQVLKGFVKGRTVFMISHGLNDTFLDLVTRIVVMENGRIAASGTHHELLKTSLEYQRLYSSSARSRAA